jgi:hypothetical protein
MFTETGVAMIKTPLSNIPGVGVMTDTFDFVKNLWGSMNVPGVNLPGMTVPTLSVEELDKKISDLQAVESWLNVNMSMLRATIQALEVQRGTIITLKSVGASLSASVKMPPSENNDRSLLESVPYASAFLFPNVGEPAAEEEEEVEEPVAQAAKEYANTQASEQAKFQADVGSLLNNPLAWWNILQDQFKHAVSTATVTDTMAKLGAAGTAMATDAVVKLGEVAAKSNLAAKPASPEPKSAAAPRRRKTTAASATPSPKKTASSSPRKRKVTGAD